MDDRHQHYCDALHDLVPFVQSKKREKHPWRSVTLTESNTPAWAFFTWCHLHNLKNVKNTHEGVLLLTNF